MSISYRKDKDSEWQKIPTLIAKPDYDKVQQMIDTKTAEYLPLSGNQSMTGRRISFPDGQWVEGQDTGSVDLLATQESDYTTYNALILDAPQNTPDVASTIKLYNANGGAGAFYKIYGEHNKGEMPFMSRENLGNLKNADFNDFTNSGNYRLQDVSTYANKPTYFNYSWGQLLVLNGNNGNTVTQILTSHISNSISMRSGYNNTGWIWTDWVELVTKDKLAGQEIAIPFVSGVTTQGNCTYCKSADGMVAVNIAADIKDKSQTKAIATLPAGYRPSSNVYASASFYDNQIGFSYGRAHVDTLGNIGYHKQEAFSSASTLNIVYVSLSYKATN